MKRAEFKYYDYQYSKEIKELLDKKINKTNEGKIKKIIKNYNSKNITRAYAFIIRDLFILYCVNNLSTSQLALVYNVGIRSVQLWLKELEMTNIRGLLKKKEKNHIEITSKEINKNDMYPVVNDSVKKDKDYALYRLLDKDRNILYIGKCERTRHSNGHGGFKDYFLRDRLIQHFTPSSKQNPKSLYLNVRYIEVTYPEVNNNKELEKIENSLIIYYERNYLSCNYNNNVTEYDEISEDKNIWTEIDSFSDEDIRLLMKKYKIDEIPSIETTNGRLKAMVWILDKQTNKIIKQRT